MDLKALMGSGDKIMLFSSPFILIGLYLNFKFPGYFFIETSAALRVFSFLLLVLGIINWLWCITLVFTKVPKKQLITTGPYAVMKHPLYTGMALLVLPELGILFYSWLGILIGLVLYIGTRIFSPDEEKALSRTFRKKWESYRKKVIMPWL